MKKSRIWPLLFLAVLFFSLFSQVLVIQEESAAVLRIRQL